MIPDREEEGYGLNEEMVRKLSEQKVKLIITVDNGVSAREALIKAKEQAIDVIVTDHHKIPDDLGEHFALIHPSETPTNSPYRYLAGVGLAYIIAMELSKSFSNDLIIQNSLDFFCIGTIADMSPLKGVNRYLLKKGLPLLSKTKSKGLQQILKLAGIQQTKNLSSEDISFRIAPRINSIGRISDTNLILKLLVLSLACLYQL